MDAPEGLGIAGEVAWKRGVRELELDGSNELALGALEMFCHALDRAALIRKAWREAGEPVVETYRNGVVGQNMFLKALQDAEAHADRLRRGLPKRADG